MRSILLWGSLALSLALLGASTIGAAGAKGSLHGQVQVLGQAGDASQLVVYLKEVNGNKGFSPAKEKPSMASKDMRFVPEVLPVLAGTSVSFPNWDEVLHNAYSVSKAKKFDLGKYGYGEANEVRFTETGVLNIYCKSHPKMTGYILVLGNPFFTMPDKKGNFSLKDIPPGKYTLVCWFPFGNPQEKVVDLAPGADLRADFALKKVRNENPRDSAMAKDQAEGRTDPAPRKR